MVRVVNFPPLNKRFQSSNVPTYIRNMDGRAKPGDKTERLKESPYNGGKVPFVRNKQSGIYNPTDIKRPAGRVSNIAPRGKYVFSQIRDDKMNLFGNTVSEQGLKKLSDIIQGVEVNDPSDTAWLEEKERITERQRLLGKSPKQIEDYLRVNKPLGREQNKTKKSEITPGQAGLSKTAMITTITDAVNRGLTTNLDAQTAVMGEVVKLLQTFAKTMDERELARLTGAIGILDPGFTWERKPIEKRFAVRDDFNVMTNPNSGFYFALVLQTRKKLNMPVLLAASPDTVRNTTLVNGVSTFKGLDDLMARYPEIYVDLKDNQIVTLKEIRDQIAVDASGNPDPVLFRMLTGGADISNLLQSANDNATRTIDVINQARGTAVQNLIVKKNQDILDLTGRRSGLKKDEITDALVKNGNDVRASKADKRKYERVDNPLIAGMTADQRRIRTTEIDRLRDITRALQNLGADLRADRNNMAQDKRDIEAQFIIDRRAIDDQADADIQAERDKLADELRRIRAIA